MIGEPFLKTVAKDLLSKYDGELSEVTVVFPNNRAKIFFNKYLYECAGKPLWSPSYTTIQQLFQSCSSLKVVDPIKLVCLLYEVYEQVLSERVTDTSEEYLIKEESLDAFYNWGTVLLSDFEDVDDNMVDAQMLFQNIKDTIPFENDMSHLTDEQRQALKRFFDVFEKGEETKLKRRFMVLWELLGEIYSRFKKRLFERNEAYEAMMKRQVVEQLSKDADGSVSMPEGVFVFVGFNVLNECERRFFKRLKDAGMARFYWDCDDFYMNEHEGKNREAGLFMRQNIKDFPNELSNVSLLKQEREVNIVGSPTENAQARYVATFLENRPEGATDDDTVVVLCNESLLLPVLHSIPNEEDDSKEEKYVNVTMGLPLLQTPLFGLVQILLSYQERLSFLRVSASHSLLSTTIIPLIRNEYLRSVFPEVKSCDERIRKNNWRYFKYADLLQEEKYGSLFKRCQTPLELILWLKGIMTRVSSLFRKNEPEEEVQTESETIVPEERLSGNKYASLYDDLYKETLYRIYQTLTKLEGFINEGILNIQLSLMLQLVEKSLSSMSVPFTGEQAEGLQVMGFLETRNLDFSNVILLSANESILPKSASESSFIPYSLRKGYGMTTIEHKNSLYAYYFYRLIQRAENITFMYNVSTESTSKGQMSRFILQMLVESGYKFNRKMIGSDAPKVEQLNLVIHKTPEILQKLRNMYDISGGTQGKRMISPSSLNEYLDCSLRFYLNRVLRIRRQEEISDEVKINEFGSVFHKAMEYFYEDMMRQIQKRGGSQLIQESDFPQDMEKDKDFSRKVEEYVMKAFRTEYFHIENEEEKLPQLSGLQLFSKDAVVRYVKKMLQIDKGYAPFKLIGNEHDIKDEISISLADGDEVRVLVGGIIDRLDEKEGIVRILDYKTGGQSRIIKEVGDLFKANAPKRYGYGMQVMIYSYLYSKKNGGVDVKTAIAYVTKAKTAEDFDLKIEGELGCANPYFPALEEGLQQTIQSIFDKDIPFSANKNGEGCKYCDFRSYCGLKDDNQFF